MKLSEINALPLEGDVFFRERAVELDRTALLLIDLQKSEYHEAKIKAEPQHAYFFDRLKNVGQEPLAKEFEVAREKRMRRPIETTVIIRRWVHVVSEKPYSHQLPS